ncbi:hypothetical protein F3Y22_tig00111402pilonHSYRG00116 [Hibiscus syriacus]|uniref:protein-serine/threonine phosphatase n=1 Tax=Hibiscus syriacus TaxID=106335 RepID=A0A6A2Y956_HIBSY|nr:hypothetical protein F3Y22_tig00111402pilonHSYRG00116 [Hibiscus syriacus]
METRVLDGIINRLLEVKGKPRKQVQLPESEIRQLYLVSYLLDAAHFFMCLNLEKYSFLVCFVTENVLNLTPHDLRHSWPVLRSPEAFLKTAASLRVPITYSWGITFGKSKASKPNAFSSHTIKYPENFFLLRGNHKCASVNHIYGFYDECKRSPYRRKNILHARRTFAGAPQFRPYLKVEMAYGCPRIWLTMVIDCLKRLDLDLICHPHQVIKDGYEFFADWQLVTVFSAPNYCGEFDNAAAVMSVDETLMCSFRILKPADKKPKFGFGTSTSIKSPTPPSRIRSLLGAKV